ncbi:glycosyltransferase family 9 protein [Streptomyces albidocamelliae]|uniref:glycosyltransferase family 9 protein n=1 Tax=Streptomyces albidocamelliae TaxID=2981135 RepID=UPI00384ED412
MVLTGGPGEEALVHSVAERSGQPARDVLTGGLPFAELSALVAGASLVLSGDTGLAHLAVAHGTRSVTLFGPVSPRLWGPPPGPRHLALWKPGPPGDPHGRTPTPACCACAPARSPRPASCCFGRSAPKPDGPDRRSHTPTEQAAAPAVPLRRGPVGRRRAARTRGQARPVSRSWVACAVPLRRAARASAARGGDRKPRPPTEQAGAPAAPLRRGPGRQSRPRFGPKVARPLGTPVPLSAVPLRRDPSGGHPRPGPAIAHAH